MVCKTEDGDGSDRSAAGDLRGRRFGDFEIVDGLGAGAMGEVYVARQLSLPRRVALKLFSPALASRPAALDRFLQEARLAASIDHPGVVPVIASGIEDGRPWIAMRLVRGLDLQDVLERRGRLAVDEALSIIARVARALHGAHEAGVVHRDIKPGNILLEGDRADLDRASDLSGVSVYLADFGLASLGDGTTLTRSGEILGTPAYMSPEQAQGWEVGPSSDIYSLGATLYHLVVGRLPFERSSDAEMMRAQILERLDGAALKDAPISPSVHYFIQKMMAKDRELRYASPAELAEEIEAHEEARRRLG